MTLGLRPEHLTETHDAERPGGGRVRRTGGHGGADGHGDADPLLHRFRSRSAPGSIPATFARHGEMLPLAADLNQMHLIDNETNRVV